MSSKKMGRPTENPKSVKLTVRLDVEAVQTLNRYCVEHQINRAEGVRRAVKSLENK